MVLVILQEFEEKIKAWCREAGEDVTYDFAQVWFIFTRNMKQIQLAFLVSARRLRGRHVSNLKHETFYAFWPFIYPTTAF